MNFMSFDSRTLRKDDSPKQRVLSSHPNCVCIKMAARLFVIKDGDFLVCHDSNPYQAWLKAELFLTPKQK